MTAFDKAWGVVKGDLNPTKKKCPECGSSEEVVQYYEGKGDFGCEQCGHQFFVEGMK